MADWYYIGHYGQLGPLTREQIDELVDGGVISRETFIWRSGMTDWIPASRVEELRPTFSTVETFAAPPPPPSAPQPFSTLTPTSPYGTETYKSEAYGFTPATYGQASMMPTLVSDRSRVLAGVLNLILPGVGRIYLGYAAHGVLQLALSLCFGLGYVWSIIDGVLILVGSVKLDGYGRRLPD